MISVIVPVYKTEKYLERCVYSILNQTYRDVEVILVDDGSPDRCPEMCDYFAQMDSRICVIHKENGGVSTARNVGLDVACGEYITFVDSDDYLENDMYEKMFEKAQKYDCDVVMCDCMKEYPCHSEVYTHEIRAGFYNTTQLKKEYYPHLLMMENVEYPATISNWTILWRSTLKGPDVRYEQGIRFSEDLLFGAKLMRKAHSFYYMKGQAYYHYVMNPSSASHSFVTNKWDDYRMLYSRIKEQFADDPQFNFNQQINLCLLFFLYNTIGEILGADLSSKEKKCKILDVLRTEEIIEMFKRLKICDLPISIKQKLITVVYKCRIGLTALILYYESK